jgi:cell division protein ZapA (FtsZ GTPase activity inhibitor)
VDRLISIKLFDQSYTFRADSEASHAENIADYVVKEVEKAGTSAEVPSKLDTVILAALNIANDYFEMKRVREELLRDIDERCRGLLDYIDANA